MARFSTVLRWWWVPLLAVLFGAVVTVAIGLRLGREPIVSESRILVTGSAIEGQADSAYTANQYVNQRLATYVALATSERVTAAASRVTGVPQSVIAGRVRADLELETAIIRLTVTGATPTDAVELCDAQSDAFIGAISELESQPPLPPRVTLTQVSGPTRPVPAVLPPVGLLAALGAVGGLLVGVLGAVVLHRLNRPSPQPERGRQAARRHRAKEPVLPLIAEPGGEPDRVPDRGLDRVPDRASDRGLDRVPDRGLDRTPDCGPDRGVDRVSDRGSDRPPDRGAARVSDRGVDRGSDRGVDRVPDRASDRGLDRPPDRGPDRGVDRVSDRGADRAPDRGAARMSDRGLDRGSERVSDRGADRGSDRVPNRGADRTSDRGPDRVAGGGPDRGPDRRAVGAERDREQPAIVSGAADLTQPIDLRAADEAIGADRAQRTDSKWQWPRRSGPGVRRDRTNGQDPADGEPRSQRTRSRPGNGG